jgi:hypothetical protein
VFLKRIDQTGLPSLGLLDQLVQHLLGCDLVRRERDAAEYAVRVFEFAVPSRSMLHDGLSGRWISRCVLTAIERCHSDDSVSVDVR